MLKYIGVLAAHIVAAVPLAAQTPGDSVTVRLSVRHGGAPVPGATARLDSSLGDPGTAPRAVSEASGMLLLRLPAPGEYRLAVSAIGYAGTRVALRLRADATRHIGRPGAAAQRDHAGRHRRVGAAGGTGD